MDFVDVDSAKFATYAEQDRRQPMNWVHRREAAKLGAYEAKVARSVDASLFVSEVEAALFRTRSGLGGDIAVAVENGIDTDYFDPAQDFAAVDDGDGPLAVFTGQMDYRPNIDAVSWFAAAVLPLLRQREPRARFAIVGRAPTEEVRLLARLPGVTVTGEVPDVRPWLAAADVVVAPLLLARGIAVYPEVGERTVSLRVPAEVAAKLKGPVQIRYSEDREVGGATIDQADRVVK